MYRLDLDRSIINFCERSIFMAENRNCGKNLILGKKSNLCSKIETLVKDRNFDQESKFWSKIQILVRHPKFWTEI